MNNHRYFKHSPQPDGTLKTIYSQRAVEAVASDSVRELFERAWKQDDFGIPVVYFNEFEILIEHTNLGYSLRVMKNGCRFSQGFFSGNTPIYEAI